jgi:hypothetical protein
MSSRTIALDLRQFAGTFQTIVKEFEHRIPIAGAHRGHADRPCAQFFCEAGEHEAVTARNSIWLTADSGRANAASVR